MAPFLPQGQDVEGCLDDEGGDQLKRIAPTRLRASRRHRPPAPLTRPTQQVSNPSPLDAAYTQQHTYALIAQDDPVVGRQTYTHAQARATRLGRTIDPFENRNPAAAAAARVVWSALNARTPPRATQINQHNEEESVITQTTVVGPQRRVERRIIEGASFDF